MSMSTRIEGVTEPTVKYITMLEINTLCRDNGIQIPKEVSDFFDGSFHPDPAGMVKDLEGHTCCCKYTADMQQGYEVDLTLIPQDITKIRLINSW